MHVRRDPDDIDLGPVWPERTAGALWGFGLAVAMICAVGLVMRLVA